MEKYRRGLAWITAAAMLAGLGGINMVQAEEAQTEEVQTEAALSEEGQTEAAQEQQLPDTLRVAFSSIGGDFSPFFAQQKNDLTAANLTQERLLASDRSGGVICSGTEGETAVYNDTEYTYYSPADCVVTENDDGTVDYEITLRNDLTFSDGEPVTIDDVIFDLYVRCDPTYDGPSALGSQPIKGLAEYRSGMDTLFHLMTAAGEDNTDFSLWTEEEQTQFFTEYDQAAIAFTQEIVDYCKASGYNSEGDTVAQCAASWGYQLSDDADIAAFWDAMVNAYGGNIEALTAAESAGSSLDDLMENYDAYKKGVRTGPSVDSIEGIERVDDYTLRISAESMNATLIYQLADTICPLHYYGDVSLYDYEDDSFGFLKGDLSGIRERDGAPLGMGPYIFVSNEDGTVYMEANPDYYKGEVSVKELVLTDAEGEDLTAVLAEGRADLAVTDLDAETAQKISDINGGDLSGTVLTSICVDNPGYGYIGLNSHNVSVGGDPSSEESKNLRRAFATLFAAYREEAILAYYGDSADVIEYPISAASWASPVPEDEDFAVAFSKDVDGNDIYTEEMTSEERYAAAKQAALGYFEAAGYTVENGKVTAPPEGASLTYEAEIPAEGIGNHPAWQILENTRDALEEMGITLTIRDLKNVSDLWSGLRAGTVAIWCAAWSGGVDPDMFPVYYAATSKSGEGAGASSYLYQIEDMVLDEMILMAREGENRVYRKALYKACLDTIMEWACVVPTYQKKDVVMFRTDSIGGESLSQDMTAFYGWDALIRE